MQVVADQDQFLWTEKYRPHTVADTILPQALKDTFQSFVDQGNVPNLLLTGKPGIGKTTVAKAMLNQLGAEYITINASLDGTKATLQNDITNFVVSTSLQGPGRKYVILDEADYLSPHFQPGLRNFMEEHSAHCGFILTANYPSRIIKEIKSRCSVLEFRIPAKERNALFTQFGQRLKAILQMENVAFDTKVLVVVINRYYPDWRHILLETQIYARKGKLDVGMLTAFPDTDMRSLLKHVRGRNFNEVRKWCAAHHDLGPEQFYPQVYATFGSATTNDSIPTLIEILADYQYKAAFAASQEINTLACVVRIMLDCVFK